MWFEIKSLKPFFIGAILPLPKIWSPVNFWSKQCLPDLESIKMTKLWSSRPLSFYLILFWQRSSLISSHLTHEMLPYSRQKMSDLGNSIFGPFLHCLDHLAQDRPLLSCKSTKIFPTLHSNFSTKIALKMTRI